MYTDASDYTNGSFASFYLNQTRVSSKNQFVFWEAYSIGPRHVGQALKRRHTAFVGPFFALMTLLEEYTERYKQTTGTYFSLIIIDLGSSYNGNSI